MFVTGQGKKVTHVAINLGVNEATIEGWGKNYIQIIERILFLVVGI